PISESKAIENAIAAQRLNAAEKKVVEKANTVTALIAAVAGQEAPSEKLTALSKQFSGYRNKSVVCRGIDLVSDLVPTFFYTSHYDRMSGQISAQKIAQDKQQSKVEPGDEIFLDF